MGALATIRSVFMNFGRGVCGDGAISNTSMNEATVMNNNAIRTIVLDRSGTQKDAQGAMLCGKASSGTHIQVNGCMC